MHLYNELCPQVEGSGLTDEITTIEPPAEPDLAHYEVFCSNLFLQLNFQLLDRPLHLNTPFGRLRSWSWICILREQSAEEPTEEPVRSSMNHLGFQRHQPCQDSISKKRLLIKMEVFVPPLICNMM